MMCFRCTCRQSFVATLSVHTHTPVTSSDRRKMSFPPQSASSLTVGLLRAHESQWGITSNALSEPLQRCLRLFSASTVWVYVIRWVSGFSILFRKSISFLSIIYSLNQDFSSCLSFQFLRQQALLAAISEKDANIALLELSSSKRKKAQEEVMALKREKDRLMHQLKQQVHFHASSEVLDWAHKVCPLVPHVK